MCSEKLGSCFKIIWLFQNYLYMLLNYLVAVVKLPGSYSQYNPVAISIQMSAFCAGKLLRMWEMPKFS